MRQFGQTVAVSFFFFSWPWLSLSQNCRMRDGNCKFNGYRPVKFVTWSARTPHLSKADLFFAKPVFCMIIRIKTEKSLSKWPQKPQLPSILESLIGSGNIFGQSDIEANKEGWLLSSSPLHIPSSAAHNSSTGTSHSQWHFHLRIS